MNAIAHPTRAQDIIAEYEEKVAAIDDEIAAFNAASTRLEMAACVRGKFVAPIFPHRIHLNARELKRNLCKSAWKVMYDQLQIERIASAQSRRHIQRTIEEAPELTLEAAIDMFGDYLKRARFHILRGLAETFANLDPAYKSHSKVRIGVKGLPKRVILSNFGQFTGSYGRDQFRDLANALAAYRSAPLLDHREMNAISDILRQGRDAVLDGSHHVTIDGTGLEKRAPDRGMSIRTFNNGNAHVFFDKPTLLDINRALAEFYGEVLPDAEDEHATHRPGTEVASDLQFYWSPPDVIDRALEFAGVHNLHEWRNNPPSPFRVLEPSCGDGRIMDVVRDRGHKILGIEVHAGRAAQARANGHNVLAANFLQCPASPDYDVVVMNPPFYGQHYLQHVRHAYKFLRPGGRLVSILPATAWYDHKKLDGHWQDLPVASFADAGTNIPTGMIRIQKPT